MFLLTLTIGVLNLCLGYALAVRLGYGPPSLACAWNALLEPAVDEPDQVGEFPADELPEGPDSLPDDGADVPEAELSEARKWEREMEEDEEHLAKLEKNLRRGKAKNDGAAISKCVIEMRQLCESLLEKQGEAVEDVGGRLGESGNAEVGGELEDALLSQLSQLETTIGNSRQVDTMADPLEAATKMLVEIERLRTVCHEPCEILAKVV